MPPPVDEIIIATTTNVLSVATTTNEITVASPGPQGPQGDTGPIGSPGGALFTHTQGSPASTWVITHNLDREPKATVIIGSEAVEADVVYNSLNQISVTFGSPQTGRAQIG